MHGKVRASIIYLDFTVVILCCSSIMNIDAVFSPIWTKQLYRTLDQLLGTSEQKQGPSAKTWAPGDPQRPTGSALPACCTQRCWPSRKCLKNTQGSPAPGFCLPLGLCPLAPQHILHSDRMAPVFWLTVHISQASVPLLHLQDTAQAPPPPRSLPLYSTSILPQGQAEASTPRHRQYLTLPA